jgi:hypothetical protein
MTISYVQGFVEIVLDFVATNKKRILSAFQCMCVCLCLFVLTTTFVVNETFLVSFSSENVRDFNPAYKGF